MTGVRLAHWSLGACCLCATLGFGETLAAAPPSSATPANPVVRERGDRSVVFELVDQPAREASASRRRATLILRLNGEPTGRQELAAIVEGTLLTRVMVSMTPAGKPGSWQAEVSLDLPVSATGVSGGPSSDGQAVRRDPQQRFYRVDVSFARLRGMGLTPFLRRSVYVNLEPHQERQVENRQEPAPVEAAPEVPKPQAPVVVTESIPLPGIERDPVAPVLDGVITESDLPLPKPAPVSTESTDYWQALEQRIAAQFAQRVKAKASPPRLPLVQFRLYWDGVARVIALERSSGSPQMDQAGMDSVVDAHPFPPFPEHIAGSYVDVHVDFSAPKAVPSRQTGRKG